MRQGVCEACVACVQPFVFASASITQQGAVGELAKAGGRLTGSWRQQLRFACAEPARVCRYAHSCSIITLYASTHR